MRTLKPHRIPLLAALLLMAAACGGGDEQEEATPTAPPAQATATSVIEEDTPTPGPTETAVAATATSVPPTAVPTEAPVEAGRVVQLDNSSGTIGDRPAQDNVAIFAGDLITTDIEGRLRITIGDKIEECRVRVLTRMQAMPSEGIELSLTAGESVCATNDSGQVIALSVGAAVTLRVDDPVFSMNVDGDGVVVIKVTSGEVEVTDGEGVVRIVEAGRRLTLRPDGSVGRGDVEFEGSEEEVLFQELAGLIGVTPTAFRPIIRFIEEEQEFEPGLAVSWELNQSFTEGTFELGYYNLSPSGEEMDSDDVLEAILESPIPNMPGFVSAEAVNPITVVVEWASANRAADFLLALSEVRIGVLIHD